MVRLVSLRATSVSSLLALAGHAGCSSTPEPRGTPDEGAEVAVASPVAVAPLPAPSSSPSPPTAPSAATAPPGVAARGPKQSDPSTFACGATTCRAGSETCCAAGDAGTCVASKDDGKVGAIGYLHTQWEECSKLQAAAGRNFDRLARCDESADCAGGAVCCENFLFSGSEGLAECMPARPSGETPCDFAETCIEGSPCRTPGTECVRGACRKKPKNQRCDAATCSATEPYCCGSSCSADATCGGGPRVMCAKDADCIKGERCLDDGGGTLCLRAHPDPDHAPWICTSAARCKSACNGYGSEPPSGRPVCETASVPWLKSCGCNP